MSADPSETTEQFSIRGVLLSTFSVLGSNFAKVTLVAVLYLLVWHVGLLFADWRAPDEFSWWNFTTGSLWGLIVSGIANAALMYGTLLALSGSRPSLRDLARGISFAIPVTVVLLVINLPPNVSELIEAGDPGTARTMAAQFAMGIIGYVLYVMCFAAPPAIIAEGLGAWTALGRSVLLTAGKRWHILGLALGGSLVFEVAQWLAERIAGPDPRNSESTIAMLAALVATYVLPAVALAFWAVLGTVTYCTLRLAKEGARARKVAGACE